MPDPLSRSIRIGFLIHQLRWVLSCLFLSIFLHQPVVRENHNNKWQHVRNDTYIAIYKVRVHMHLTLMKHTYILPVAFILDDNIYDGI